MGRSACTEPQCLYSRAIPLLPLWTVRPVQSLSASTRLHCNFTFYCLIIDSKASKNENKTKKLSHYCLSIVKHRMLCDSCHAVHKQATVSLIRGVCWTGRRLTCFCISIYIFIDRNNHFTSSCVRGIIVTAFRRLHQRHPMCHLR
jgi:hypothetical protein